MISNRGEYAMLLEIKNHKILSQIKTILKEENVEFEEFESCYDALAHKEAGETLNYLIEANDLFITKDKYEECFKKIKDDLYNNDEDIMQDLTNLAHDLAADVLREENILVD